MDRCFKGGKFKNRYKITGTLTAKSPLHIGDGAMEADENRLPKTKDDKIPEYSTVMTDVKGRAYIPGSTLKGNMRNWIEQLLTDFNLACINDVSRTKEMEVNFENFMKKSKEMKEVYKKLHDVLKTSEHLFGSSTNEGKLEFWDAHMEKPPAIPANRSEIAYSGYSPEKGTIIMKSVVIDPVTGTAAKNLLYNYEAVPQGAVFNLTISGQNLDDDELGILLFVLEGFNSAIYPVTLGANNSIGFGRCAFKFGDIYHLDKNNLAEWIKKAVEKKHAGYEGLERLAEKQKDDKIKNFRASFLSKFKKEN
jgi:CRISPR-associated protein Csm3